MLITINLPFIATSRNFIARCFEVPAHPTISFNSLQIGWPVGDGLYVRLMASPPEDFSESCFQWGFLYKHDFFD
jgi:hypothetical protein